MAVGVLLAAGPDPDLVSPGFLGFAVVFLLAVATYLLIRSMVGRLRKVRYRSSPSAAGSVVTPATPGAPESGTGEGTGDGDGDPTVSTPPGRSPRSG